MSDIFSEVDEEVRREQFKKLWERYNALIVAGIVVIVLAVAAWRGYEWWQAKKAAESGAQFEAALTLSEQGKTAEAEAAFGKIAADGTAGYRELSSLRAAGEAAQRDPKAGVDAYDKLSHDSSLSSEMQDLAALRAGALLIDTATYEDVRKRLETLANPDRPFHHMARELLALAAWHSGDAKATQQWIETIMSDPATPPSTRSRAEILSALISGDKKS